MTDFRALEILLERMKYEKELAQSKAEEADQRLRAVATTIELLHEHRIMEEVGEVEKLRESSQDDEFVAELRKKKTQLHALIAIAKKNNGKLFTRDAKPLLQRAKLMKQTKNASNILYNVINRSERFRHVGAGEYDLIETQQEKIKVAGKGDLFETPMPPVQ